jgi:hypothetical protein
VSRAKSRASSNGARKNGAGKKKSGNGIAAGYNRYKEHEGRRYTGMTIGRTHHWHYDRSDWKERKVAPDKWEFTYSTTKRRRKDLIRILRELIANLEREPEQIAPVELYFTHGGKEYRGTGVPVLTPCAEGMYSRELFLLILSHLKRP